MIKSFEFYFDFASPYTFLAHKQIRKIEKENSIKIKYMPIPQLPKEGRRLVSRHLNKDLYYDDGAYSLNAHTQMKPDQANLQ